MFRKGRIKRGAGLDELSESFNIHNASIMTAVGLLSISHFLCLV